MTILPGHLLDDAMIFLDRIFENMRRSQIDVSELELDHICYRVATIEEYIQMRDLLSEYGTILKGEHMIGGRPIATFQLDTPIGYHSREISLIELPSPKPGSPYVTGWEHAEFVIDTDLESFMLRYPSIDWDTRAIHKPINPDISIQFENQLSIKFHMQSLDYVINYLE